MSGRILVLEGLDGVGKTTAARLLAETIGAVVLSTPDASIKCARRSVDEIYRESPNAAHLFYASCVAHASARAARERACGRDVIIDRYWLSTWAYGAVRGARLRLDEVEASLCGADFTFLLTLEEEERRERLRLRGMTEGDRQTLDAATATKVLQSYHDGLRRPVAGRGVVLDVTGKNPKECVAAILERLAPSLARGPRRP